MSAVTGVKPNNAVRSQGANFMDLLGLTKAQADTLEWCEVISYQDADGNNQNAYHAVYSGSGAITLSNFAKMGKGSIIIDTQAFKIHMKVADAGTSTWKSSAAMS